MKFFSLLCFAAIASATLAPLAGAAAQSDDAVRSGFLISRREAPAKPKRRPRAAKPRPVAAKTTQTPAGALGLGYSVYKRAASGAAVRVAPEAPLRDGDQVRVVVESNEDGYLYVFNTDDKGSPAAMIFPDARLNAGDNRIGAHVPYEIPSSGEADASLRWLHLAGGPVTDVLHVVVTREPLPEVPTREALLAYCARRGGDCLWTPEATAIDAFARASEESRTATAASLVGREMSRTESGAIQRSVRLRPSAPAPTVVRMNVSSDAASLVATIDLRH